MEKVIQPRDSGQGLDCQAAKDGRTKNSFVNECDINSIMAKYEKTGILPTMNMRGTPMYGDFTNLPSYQEACNIVLKAQEQFDSLPMDIRERFNNEPDKFMEFVNDSKNEEEMIKMGLAVAKPKKEENKPETKVEENKPEVKTEEKK
jgi:phage internal scaffolding protein